MVNARILAYQILLQLDGGSSYPDRLIRSMLDRYPLPEDRDRALLTELVYGVLRHQGRLDWHIDQISKIKPRKITPPVRILLRLALYQMLFLDRVPSHAAVNETVKIARFTQPSYVTGFINGVLREASRRHPDWDYPSLQEDPEKYLTVMTSHPEWFVRRFLKEKGFEETQAICSANNRVAPLVLRVNSLKTTREEALSRLIKEDIDAEPSPVLPQAIRILGIRRDIARTDLYETGEIQIQDEASQLIAHLLSPQPGERILDLCSGFGGKSTHLGILMHNQGEILAVDEASWKLEQLRHNAQRQGIEIIQTLTGDVLKLSPDSLGFFDRVLLDAPCSGFGSVRRNPDIKYRCHPKDPYRFSLLQESFLRHAARFVKKGGVLVYATCTLFSEENESVAERFAGDHPQWSIEPAADFLPENCRFMVNGPFFRSWPHRHGIDGFFGCRMVKG